MLLSLQRVFTTEPLLNWQDKRIMSPALTSWQGSRWQLLPPMFHLCEPSAGSRILFPHTGCSRGIIKRDRVWISLLFLKNHCHFRESSSRGSAAMLVIVMLGNSNPFGDVGRKRTISKSLACPNDTKAQEQEDPL